jgi:epoxyqueuosine reductase QueG
MAVMAQSSLELEMLQELTEFVQRDQRNALAAHGGMRMYDSPLLTVAAADDPLFDQFTEPGIIGPRFLKPRQWLAGARSVLAFYLPFTQAVCETNRKRGLPSEVWVSARIDGETFNQAVRSFLVDLLAERGAQACAPTLDPRFRVEARIANWSERHAAYVAGMGTFGLHRALITAKGSTGRIGSVITTLALPPTPRPYTRYDEYCLFLTHGKCGACIPRCPPSAISPSGKDHDICSGYIDREILSRFKPRYGCAKCNLNVPCEKGIPVLPKGR